MAAFKSNINILGGYRDFDSIPEKIGKGELLLNERTESSSKRYIKAIQETFLRYENESHEQLFSKAMSSEKLSLQAKQRILSLQFYSTDLLFKILFNECFLTTVQSGRVVITKHDVIAFFRERISEGELDIDWSDETIKTVSRKFLTILKKLGYVDGSAKKRIKEVYNGSEFLIFFHYWLDAINDSSNILLSDYFSLLMISTEKYLFLMKQDDIKDKIDWDYTGDRFTIRPKKPIKEYLDEL